MILFYISYSKKILSKNHYLSKVTGKCRYGDIWNWLQVENCSLLKYMKDKDEKNKNYSLVYLGLIVKPWEITVSILSYIKSI